MCPRRTPISKKTRPSTTKSIVCATAATSALFERRDVIIVASVSCIYGLGSPEDYLGLTLSLKHGDLGQRDRDKILRRLVAVQYQRNDVGFTRGTFRVRGDVVEIIPVYNENIIRLEFFGDEIDRISWK
jgi:excinuclease ABC subunit B